MVILKMVFLFTISLPELYPVSVLQNFMSALLTGCVGNDSNLLIVFYVQIMPDDFVMQLHRF